MRTSIRDIAARAGVSAVTVSNVLRGRESRASEETRERVLEIARELQYVPVAQPLTQSRHTQTHIIGLVFDHGEPEEYWGTRTFRGLREGALEHGYDLLTILRARPNWMLDAEELNFLDRRSDGLIFIVPRDRYGVLESLVRHKIPAVSCFIADVPPGVATVVLDDVDAMRQAVKYLVERGHKRIAHLAYHAERADFAGRVSGYRSAMKSAGLARHINIVQGGDEDGWQPRVVELVEKRGVTALTCSNDLIALIARNLADERGWRVPQDLSLIGMDDMPQAEKRGLTSMRFSSEAVGRFAVEAIVRLMNGETAASCSKVVPVELIERISVAPLLQK
jgi:LacI family transcriptional regulator